MTNMYSNPGFDPAFLSQNPQDLLMTALQSNLPEISAAQLGQNTLDFTSASLDPSMLSVSQPDELYDEFDFSAFNDPSMIDLLDSADQPDADFDFDQDQNDELSPDDEPIMTTDPGEKRKSMADEKDGNENGAKRREGEEKQAKKPGRKPLTSEPTTKRKAQNRAAQRAFRERKEKHLHDLEDKVSELEKNSESTTHENGVLRAQVEQLQRQLREYRKRLVQSKVGRSPPSATLGSFSSSASASVNHFSFDFQRFQSVPYGPLFGNTPIQSSPQSTMIDFSTIFGTNSGHVSSDATSSSDNQATTPATTNGTRSQHGSIAQESPKTTSGSPFGDHFSDMRTPSLSTFGPNKSKAYNIFTSQTTAEPGSMAQNSESSNSQSRGDFVFVPTASASPSASSSSHSYGASSSCGTSPEPTAGANKEPTLNTIEESDLQTSGSVGQKNQSSTISDTLHPSIGAISNGTSSFDFTGPLTANSNPFFSFGDQDLTNWPSFQESSAATMADGAFNGGFFTDSSDLFGMSMPAPMNWNDLTGTMRTGLTPVAEKSNPFETIKSTPKIKVEICPQILKEIRQQPGLQDINPEDIDIDSLCSELKKKAKCTENGMVIAKEDVDEALIRRAASLSS